jgi:hypothetical protein
VSRLPKTLCPLTELAALAGVCGGVVKGIPPTNPDIAAPKLGTFPKVGVGLLITLGPGVGAKEDCVATDEVELDLVGLEGRTIGTGDGDGGTPDERDRTWSAGAVAEVGVGTGVE